jgi:hypothetical protein
MPELRSMPGHGLQRSRPLDATRLCPIFNPAPCPAKSVGQFPPLCSVRVFV